jgi:hypothetical protein
MNQSGLICKYFIMTEANAESPPIVAVFLHDEKRFTHLHPAVKCVKRAVALGNGRKIITPPDLPIELHGNREMQRSQIRTIAARWSKYLDTLDIPI